jgi:hypothetical protein
VGTNAISRVPAAARLERRAADDDIKNRSLLSDVLERQVVVDGAAVAWPLDVDLERRPERCPWTRAQGNDAIGEQQRFVDVVGDEDDRAPL